MGKSVENCNNLARRHTFFISLAHVACVPFSSCSTNFRRTGPSSWVNLAFGAMLGLISGNYIFGEPLRQMAEERRLEEAAKAQQQQQSHDASSASK